ncbi:MAG: DNA-formamidopyrimidine glycosylase family protein [Acidimicrobiales bacterium]
MPEGHTIHRLARDLGETLGGSPVLASSPQGRFAAGAGRIHGETLVRSEAYGKYLFCEFTGGALLHVHLGLIGKFRPQPAETVPGDTIRLRLENDTVAWHLTGPARCDLIGPDEEAAIVATLGVDPLRPRPNVARLRRAFAATRAPIGAVLLDQRVIAGIGNVYRAELLFLCGIHPARPASSLTDDEVTRLFAEARRQLRRGVRLNRIVTTDPREIGRPLSKLVDHGRLYVYHRSHCRRCGTELQTLAMGGRPIQFCPVCQPA